MLLGFDIVLWLRDDGLWLWDDVLWLRDNGFRNVG